MASFRDLDSYVLLGEPGSGKTSVFRQEAEALGNSALYFTARDFLCVSTSAMCAGKTLFIDALDERRAVLGNSSAPLDEIRTRLAELGKPRFRLSCREADWLQGGAQDLSLVAPSGNVRELRLDRLSESDIRTLLGTWLQSGDNAINEFFEEAHRHDLGALLGSPLLLKLLSSVVCRGQWPKSRSAVYALACKQMAQEHNTRHRDSCQHGLIAEDLLQEAAGKLSALLLLADISYITKDPGDCGEGGALVADIPISLELDAKLLSATLGTKLFGAEGERYAPWHRTIAEYLGGKALAKLVMERGLPIRRLLALMTGEDGGVVDSLRGLHGWLTVHCLTERELLIQTDPVGLVLYGDVRDFSTAEKTLILGALGREAIRFPWFRNGLWLAHPFGALGTSDMVPELRHLLQRPDRDLAHEALLECVIDAVIHGDALPDLAQDMRAALEDATHFSRTRRMAASAWLRCINYNAEETASVLEDFRVGKFADEDDELVGHILAEAYPNSIPAPIALRHLHAAKATNLIGNYHMFWADDYVEKMPDDQIPEAMATALALIKLPEVNSDQSSSRFSDTLAEIACKLLLRALQGIGDDASDKQLHEWFGLRLSRYGSVETDDAKQQSIDEWLTARPRRMKALLLSSANGSKSLDAAMRRIWEIDSRLHRARRPRNWYRWLLLQASRTDDLELARHWVVQAAHVATHPLDTFAIDLDDVWSWVEANSTRWPEATSWVEESTSCRLDDWRGRDHLRTQRVARASSLRLSEHRARILPLLPAVFDGAGELWLMGEISLAYKKELHGVAGNDAIARVSNYLGGTPEEAWRAIKGICAALSRDDLPTLDEIKVTHAEGKRLWLSYVCLLAAELLFEANPEVIRAWSEPTLEALIGCQLVDAHGRQANWLTALYAHRSADVLRILRPLAERDIAHPTPQLSTYYFLRKQEAPQAFVRELLPVLLNAIPNTPSPDQMRLFNEALVSAARRHLALSDWSNILSKLLAGRTISVEFCIALHTASIEFDPELHLIALRTLADVDADIALTIRKAIQTQEADWTGLAQRRPEVLGWLAELLADCAVACGDPLYHEPNAPSEREHRTIYNSLMVLARISSKQAATELGRLRQLACMSPWASELDWCIGEQRLLRRACTFFAPPLPQVAEVLANRAPANARDMAILILDQMTRLAQRIRDSNPNQLDLFWEPDGRGGRKPRGENECRDVLLGLIRPQLQLQNVTLEKEVPSAADKRADLQGSTLIRGELVVVPVEIKKENHTTVWSAWWDQLEARYTKNPAAAGIGIYLVLWFGYAVKNHPSGARPQSAEQAAALFTTDMPADRNGRTFGLVIDLSPREE